MQPEIIEKNQLGLFQSSFQQILNPRDTLLQLSHQIPWDHFEQEFATLFTPDLGHPPKPIRLIVGLLMLQHMEGLSDEQVVLQWERNFYWQAFCGYDQPQWQAPIHPSSLTHWRQCLGQEGLEKILAATVQVAVKTQTIQRSHLKDVTVDTTVQEAAIRYPTDTSLLNEMLQKLVSQAKKEGLPLRQSYTRIGPQLERKARGYAHSKQMKRLGKVKKN